MALKKLSQTSPYLILIIFLFLIYVILPMLLDFFNIGIPRAQINLGGLLFIFVIVIAFINWFIGRKQLSDRG